MLQWDSQLNETFPLDSLGLDGFASDLNLDGRIIIAPYLGQMPLPEEIRLFQHASTVSERYMEAAIESAGTPEITADHIMPPFLAIGALAVISAFVLLPVRRFRNK